MMNLNVLYNGKEYVWVDTLVRHDEIEYVVAVLVSPKSRKVFCIDISVIEVIDTSIIPMSR